MSRPIWSGLAVIDSAGRSVLWRGSDTPKLYRSEEQGKYARTEGCTLEEVVIISAALFRSLGERETIQPARAAYTPDVDVPPFVPRVEKPAAQIKRVFEPIQCKHRGCAATFVPKGARSKFCDAHVRRVRAA